MSDRFLGESSGTDFITLLQTEMPVHTHFVEAYQDDNALSVVPSPTAVIGKAVGGSVPFNPASNTQMAFNALSVSGGSLPHNNMMPFLTVNFIIAMQGVFPPRG